MKPTYEELMFGPHDTAKAHSHAIALTADILEFAMDRAKAAEGVPPYYTALALMRAAGRISAFAMPGMEEGVAASFNLILKQERDNALKAGSANDG